MKRRFRSSRELLARVERALASRPSKNHSPLQEVVDLLYQARNYFWLGIYLACGGELVRRAFRGPMPPCHSFALGTGNVGTAGRTGRVKIAPDVSRDPGPPVSPPRTFGAHWGEGPTYSLCFVETKSEIVAPIRLATQVLGVIDVESDRLNAFSFKDRVLLKGVAARLARFLTGRGKLLVRKVRQKAEQPGDAPAGDVPARHPPRSDKRVAAAHSSRGVAGERFSR